MRHKCVRMVKLRARARVHTYKWMMIDDDRERWSGFGLNERCVHRSSVAYWSSNAAYFVSIRFFHSPTHLVAFERTSIHHLYVWYIIHVAMKDHALTWVATIYVYHPCVACVRKKIFEHNSGFVLGWADVKTCFECIHHSWQLFAYIRRSKKPLLSSVVDACSGTRHI